MSFSTVFYRGLLVTVGLASFGCASVRSRSDDHRVPSAISIYRNKQAEQAPPPALHPVREELDVVYSHAGGEDQQLDLYVPKDGPGPYPVVVVLHGGGWAKGSHVDHRQQASTLAGQGYVAASVGYRLAPRHKFPAQIHDVKCAVRWLRANADRYGIDRQRVGVVGYSAGAHLALLLGMTEAQNGLEGDGGNPDQSSGVQAVINLAGPTDLTRPDWPEFTRAIVFDWIGGSLEQMPDVYRAASPITYVHRGAPPVLTIHGTEDKIVPYEQAKLLHSALRRAKVPSRLEPVHGKGHGENWTPEDVKHMEKLIREFFDKNLRQM
jgi:acetyl esterase/lipase